MEDASVRAGLHHDAGPVDTQRGNLTAGGRPGQVVPAVQEQPFQPASPDTMHSKQMKVRACCLAVPSPFKAHGGVRLSPS